MKKNISLVVLQMIFQIDLSAMNHPSRKFSSRTQSDKRIRFQHQIFKQKSGELTVFPTNFYDFSNFSESTKNILL